MNEKHTTDRAKLETWKERLAQATIAYDGQRSKMDRREALYRGEKSIKAVTRNGKDKSGDEVPHIRNICAELIEAQVDSSIPAPKVTARRKKDVEKARLIEDMLRCELDRLPFEQMNDMMARTVPIQGGGGYLVEWDSASRTHFSVGELAVSTVHPKQIIPQDGIYSGVNDMDYIFLLVPQTKEYIHRKYGVNVDEESESEPDVRSATGTSSADDLVTQNIAYYRNENGGIGLYSWVNEIQLEDLEDYQARRLQRCASCGGAMIPGEDGETVCASCGGLDSVSAMQEYEEVMLPIKVRDGEIPGMVQKQVEGIGPDGLPVTETVTEPTRIPLYKPDIYPIVMQKNVSVYGSFLGDSDIDKVEDQQNTINRIEKTIIDKLLSSGSYMTLPEDASIKVDEDDMKTIRLKDAADKQMIDVYDMEGAISQDVAYLAQVYEESRQIIGITDSFQGRADTTATSGKAKEFAAAQTAGRLESKRTMKNAAYAALFEAMFKFRLAYTDEPFPVRREDVNGNVIYEEFNRYDFLEKDEAGEWYWNDAFLFSCDASATLASNREAMWQETRLNLTSGAFGDPTSLDTLILFWAKMEQLHYPLAGETKRYLEQKLQEQRMREQMAAQQQMMAAQASAGNEEADVRAVLEQARRDAERDAMMGRRR